MPSFFCFKILVQWMNECLLINLSVIIRLYVVNNPYSIYVCHICNKFEIYYTNFSYHPTKLSFCVTMWGELQSAIFVACKVCKFFLAIFFVLFPCQYIRMCDVLIETLCHELQNLFLFCLEMLTFDQLMNTS